MHVHASHGGERTSKVLRVSLVVTLATLCCWSLPAFAPIRWRCSPKPGTIFLTWLLLLLSLVAVYLQARPPSATKTYGWHRAGVLAALVNAGSLVVISFLIFYEAFRRLQNPEQVHAGLMMGVAAAGVVMNGVIALLLYRSEPRCEHSQRLAARDRRHGFDRGGHCRRLGDYGDRPILD